MRYLSVMWVGLAGSVAMADPGPDATVAERVVGKWTTCLAGGSSTAADGTIRYAPDRTFVAEGRVDLGGGTRAAVRVEGAWAVEGGCLVHTVAKTTHPGLAPVGAELRERVLAVDGKTLRVRRGAGKERERTRVEG